jgi:hypothetical protein
MQRTLAAVLLVVFTLSAAPQNAILEGVVVDGATGQPVPGQMVQVSEVPRESTQFPERPRGSIIISGSGKTYGPVMSDAAGRFQFTDLPAGWFEISVYGRGSGRYGQTRPADPEQMLFLSRDQRRSGLQIRLFTNPTVSGRVIDEAGRPVVEMTMGALGVGQSLEFSSSTDDRGMYSYTLEPGDYVPVARPSISRMPVSSDGRPMVYPATFAPGTASVALARVVTLRMGDNVEGQDIRLVPVPSYTVTVSLLPVDSKVFGDVWLANIVSNERVGSIIEGSMSKGRLVFAGVPAGAYELRAFIPPEMPHMSHGVAPLQALPAEPTLWATVPVTVADKDVVVTLALQPGVRINGSVVFEGGSPPAFNQRPPIVVERQDNPSADLRGLYLSSSTFTTIQLPPGGYFLRPIPPQGFRLKSITIAGRDVLDAVVDVDSADLAGVTITFTNRPGRLQGTVGLDGSADSVRPWVTVFPVDRSLWTNVGAEPARLARIVTGASGNYETTLPAGTYYVAATAAPISVPQDFEALAAVAATVVITDGNAVTQNFSIARRLR